jgi:hypothetical protein
MKQYMRNKKMDNILAKKKDPECRRCKKRGDILTNGLCKRCDDVLHGSKSAEE